MPLLLILLIIAATLLIAVLIASLWIVKQALYPRKFSYEKSYLLEVENGRFNEEVWNSWEKHEVTLRSPYGYDLSGTWLPLTGSKKTIILLHGFPYTRIGMIKYIPVFRSRGFNVLIYDQRYFGRSGGPFTSYGYYEKHDLKAALDWVLEQTGPDSLVGTLGESMGGATVLLHGAIDPRPAFIIANSCYADLREAMQIRLRDQYHLPAFPLMSLGARLLSIFGGFTPEQASPGTGCRRADHAGVLYPEPERRRSAASPRPAPVCRQTQWSAAVIPGTGCRSRGSRVGRPRCL